MDPVLPDGSWNIYGFSHGIYRIILDDFRVAIVAPTYYEKWGEMVLATERPRFEVSELEICFNPECCNTSAIRLFVDGCYMYRCKECADFLNRIKVYAAICYIDDIAMIAGKTYKRTIIEPSLLIPQNGFHCDYCGLHDGCIPCNKCTDVIRDTWQSKNFPKYLLLLTRIPIEIAWYICSQI